MTDEESRQLVAAVEVDPFNRCERFVTMEELMFPSRRSNEDLLRLAGKTHGGPKAPPQQIKQAGPVSTYQRQQGMDGKRLGLGDFLRVHVHNVVGQEAPSVAICKLQERNAAS